MRSRFPRGLLLMCILFPVLDAVADCTDIVVGKKVFVGSEPDELVCVDTDSGKILWKTSVMIDQFIPEADRAAVRRSAGCARAPAALHSVRSLFTGR